MKDYLEILDTYKEEMVETLRELCRFPSVAEATDPSAESPFGPAVQGALDYMLDKAARDGFAVKNVDNYGGHIDFPGKNATAEDPGDIVALVGHLDVVPVGDLSQWESDPFEMEIRDGKMYGRGTVDDKGPLLAAYFAVRALKEAGFVPEKTIRIMLGCDEETNWDGMTYYMEHEKVTPVSGFSPDAMFPVLYAEKGCLAFEVEGTFKESPSDGKADSASAHGLRLVSIKGGSVVNAVPDKAEDSRPCTRISGTMPLPSPNCLRMRRRRQKTALQRRTPEKYCSSPSKASRPMRRSRRQAEAPSPCCANASAACRSRQRM